jgi:homoserine O-acetyltransferase
MIGELGRCTLSGGAVLEHCRLSYRVYGRLNDARDNAVLLTTWFRGTSADWERLLGEGGVVDTTRFAGIAVDAFGAGGSSAPSEAPSGLPFPEITIRDMVNAQHLLLTRTLRVTHLIAVVGYSMGGMQAFEWGVAHSAFTDRIVSIEGSPRLSRADSLLWGAVLRALRAGRDSSVSRDSAAVMTARLLQIAYSTDDGLESAPGGATRRALAARARTLDEHQSFDDMGMQVAAMLSHDVTAPLGGSMEAAHRAMSARLLVVASPQDRAITQEPALAFAEAVHGERLVLASPCGHRVLFCELERIGLVTRTFLEH